MSLDALCEITRRIRWREVAESIVLRSSSWSVSTDEFGMYWIEAGHRMREQIADDLLLCKLLRRVLHPYSGGAVTLYRGENQARWHKGQIGFAWSQEIEVARMFGRGLNATNDGGVLLQAFFVPASIICGPNNHSSYLGEQQYTVDPLLAKDIQLIERYPPL